MLVAVSASLLALSLFSGCATTGKNASESALSSRDGSPSESTRASRGGVSRGDVGNKEEIVVAGVKLQNTDFDFPVTINSRVEHWIDYFTGRGRKHFTRY